MQNYQHVGDADLASLVFDDLNDQSFESLAAHLESCSACRNRLDLISGSEEFDQLTREILDTFPEMGKLEVPDSREEIQPSVAVISEYFEPPSHPEMLGRLGRYDIESLIGSGGMGVVFRARQETPRREVALKILFTRGTPETLRARFRREIDTLASLSVANGT